MYERSRSLEIWLAIGIFLYVVGMFTLTIIIGNG